MERWNKANQQWLDHTIYGIRIALKHKTSYVLRDNTLLIFIKGMYPNFVILFSYVLVKILIYAGQKRWILSQCRGIDTCLLL